jgi:hypothetical protein
LTLHCKYCVTSFSNSTFYIGDFGHVTAWLVAILDVSFHIPLWWLGLCHLDFYWCVICNCWSCAFGGKPPFLMQDSSAKINLA